MIALFLLVLFAEILFTLGHVYFKKAANQLETPSSQKSRRTYLLFLQKVLGLPAVWWGVSLICFALLIWLLALSLGDLSLVYPLSSLQYLLTLFAAAILLKEKMNFQKIAGTLLIVLGIIVLAFS